MVISRYILTPALRGAALRGASLRGAALRGTHFARERTLRGQRVGPPYVDVVVSYRGGLSLNIPICLANVKERKFLYFPSQGWPYKNS